MNNIKNNLKGYLILSLILICNISPVSAALIVNPELTITQAVTIQPIILSDTDGSNTAEFFGNSAQQLTIEGLVDDIWSQAGIDINFLSANMWNNNFANWGAGGPPDNGGLTRPGSDINTIVSDGIFAGVTNIDVNVINMFFVNIPAGFSLPDENSAAGLAYVGGNGITQYVGSNLLGSDAGLETIAGVVSHEIGHNLGLDHIVEAENLMQSADATNLGNRLNDSQITLALASDFSVAITPVPVPPSLVLFLSGFGLFGLFRRRSFYKAHS